MRDLIRRPSVAYFLLYFGLLSIFQWQFNRSLFLLWMGGVMGTWFVWVDRIAHVYLTKPHEQLSVQVKSLIDMKRYKEAFIALDHRKSEQKTLTVRSALFLGVWIFLAIFVLTSTGSVFATGMIMGIGLSILIEMVQDWHNLPILKSRLFWQIKKDFSDKETRVVVIGYGVLFSLFSLLLL